MKTKKQSTDNERGSLLPDSLRDEHLWKGVPKACVYEARRAFGRLLVKQMGDHKMLLDAIFGRATEKMWRDFLMIRFVRVLGSWKYKPLKEYVQQAVAEDDQDFISQLGDALDLPPPKWPRLEWHLIVQWVSDSKIGLPPLCYWSDEAILHWLSLLWKVRRWKDCELTFDNVRKTRQRLGLKKVRRILVKKWPADFVAILNGRVDK